MPTQMIDMKEVAAKNRRVDPAKVKEVMDTLVEVGKHGLGRANYSIQSPYTRTKVKPSERPTRPPRLKFTR